MKKAIVIAIGNQKGGCGKTTVTANLSYILWKRGYRVLAVDLDSSRNLSITTPGYDEDSCTILQLLRGESIIENGKKRKLTAADVIQHGNGNTYDLISSEKDLKQIDQILTTERNPEKRYHALRDALETVRSEYDFILIDCPPSLCERYDNAYAAADYIIIPTQLDKYSAQAVSDALITVLEIKEQWNPELKIAGMLRTMAQLRVTESKEWSQQLAEIATMFDTRLFDTAIRYGTKPCSKALDNGTCLVADNPYSNPALDYARFADELLQLIGA